MKRILKIFISVCLCILLVCACAGNVFAAEAENDISATVVVPTSGARFLNRWHMRKL